MNPSLRPLSDLLRTERGQHRIPFFQRSYSWNRSRVAAFLEFIKEISERVSGPEETKFIGFMVTEPPHNGSGLRCLKFDVIDGQQRITTFSLILIALYKVTRDLLDNQQLLIQKVADPVEREKLNSIIELFKAEIEDIKFKYLENRNFKHTDYWDDRLKLVPQDDDRANYKLIYENNLRDATTTCLTDAYDEILTFFKKELYPKDKKLDEYFTNLQKFIAAIQSLQVVQLELTEHDDPQKIFETINDKGMPLSTVDIIKNRIFTPSEPDNVTEQLARNWHDLYWKPSVNAFKTKIPCPPNRDADDFHDKLVFQYIKNILFRNGVYITKKGLSLFVKKQYQKKNEREKFLTSFLNLTNYYIAILGKNKQIVDEVINYEKLKVELNRLQNLEFEAATPFILKLFENNVQQSEICSIVSLLERYFVRRSICGESVKDLPKVFVHLCLQYNTNYPSGMSVFDWLNKEFKIDQEKEKPETRIYNYPKDSEVRRELSTKNLYKYSRDLSCYLLLRANEIAMGKEYPTLNNKIQVEHVMPQTLSEQWKNYLGYDQNTLKVMHEECVGLIGNLTLTMLNPEMSNKMFSDKKSDLEKSSYKLTKDIVSYSTWKKEDIIHRSNVLIDFIVKALPDLP